MVDFNKRRFTWQEQSKSNHLHKSSDEESSVIILQPSHFFFLAFGAVFGGRIAWEFVGLIKTIILWAFSGPNGY